MNSYILNILFIVGGFKLELLDKQERLLKTLTPPDAFVGADNTQVRK